jgi:CRISP-associated protein Cas1
MISRTVYVGSPSKLQLENAQLVLIRENGAPASIPVEDIGILVLDHYQLSVTHSLVNALLENGVALLWCDQKHLPSGLLLPVSGHHAHTAVLRYQLESSDPLRKNLWKQTVQQKIHNQAGVLSWSNMDPVPLLTMVATVQSGDTGNVEGRAAAIYWKALFAESETFKRERFGDAPNNMLNYCYAVLRAVVARAIVGSGLHPALGIFHRNKYNPYCLADDLMEPYRPFADKLVLHVCDSLGNELPEELTPEIKRELLQLPVMDVRMQGETMPLMNACQKTSASLVQCFKGEIRKMAYPELN